MYKYNENNRIRTNKNINKVYLENNLKLCFVSDVEYKQSDDNYESNGGRFIIDINNLSDDDLLNEIMNNGHKIKYILDCLDIDEVKKYIKNKN